MIAAAFAIPSDTVAILTLRCSWLAGYGVSEILGQPQLSPTCGGLRGLAGDAIHHRRPWLLDLSTTKAPCRPRSVTFESRLDVE